jgi:MFS family permease
MSPPSLTPALSTAAPDANAGLRGTVRLVLVGLGISVVPLDTAVNIAFPDITGSFGLPIAMIQWVIICYVLTHAGLMLALGRAGDIWGHARVFRAGLLWSAVAFLLCAAAPSFGGLLFCRFLQGIGAGLIISCAPALVTALYPEARRSHALGIFTLMFALGSALGPVIGGALVARYGWPAVFWFRAPIALVSLAFLRGLPQFGGAAREQRFDILGALLLALGLAGLLFAINALPRLPQGDYLALLLVPCAAASLVFFVCWERRTAQPIIRIDLFRNARFALINAAGSTMNFSAFSVMLIGPYFLVRYTGLTVPRAGLVLASGFIAMAGNSLFAGRLVARLGAARVGPLGALLTATGLCSVATWQPDTAPALMVMALALHGIGMSFFQVAYMELVLAASPLADRGVAGSLSMLTRTVGVVVAAAGLTLLFQTQQQGALAGGADAAAAFVSAFRVTFLFAGSLAAVTAAALVWSARGRGNPAD